MSDLKYIYKGEAVSEYCKRVGFSYNTFHNRVKYQNMTVEEVLETPIYEPDSTMLRTKYSMYINDERGHGFNLTIEEFDLITSLPCYYCGFDEARNDIDRMDSTKGYMDDNMITCCWPCNRMKGSMSHIEFLNHIQKIYSWTKGGEE